MLLWSFFVINGLYFLLCRLAPCHWWSSPMSVSSQGAGPPSCGTTCWLTTLRWASQSSDADGKEWVLRLKVSCLIACSTCGLYYMTLRTRVLINGKLYNLKISISKYNLNFSDMFRTLGSSVTLCGQVGVNSQRCSVGSSQVLQAEDSIRISLTCWGINFWVCFL